MNDSPPGAIFISKLFCHNISIGMEENGTSELITYCLMKLCLEAYLLPGSWFIMDFHIQLYKH